MTLLNNAKNKISKRLIFEIVLILIIIGLCLFIFFAPSATGNSRVISVTYITPNDKFTNSQISGTPFNIPDGDKIDGYQFVGWKDSSGNFVEQKNAVLYEDTSFSAVYSIKLNDTDHFQYIDLENNLFRPGDAITNAEAAKMIYRLMDTNLVGTATFVDVDETDDCYKAAATLKDLGIIDGVKFHPNEGMTEDEFYDLLSRLYPAEVLSKKIPDLEDGGEDFVRRDVAAHYMNTLLGRYGDSNKDYKKVGTILDVSFDNEYYFDIAEATIEHKYSGSGKSEKWESSIALETRKQGFFFVGPVLHYVDENGSPVVDEDVGTLHFDSSGRYTSGDKELDNLIWSAMEEQLDLSILSYQDLLLLRQMYSYLVENGTYKRLDSYAMGATGWEIEDAKSMLTTMKGNCYHFAAAFYEIARAMGFEGEAISGTEGADDNPHAWVELDVFGEIKIFDPEIEYARKGFDYVDAFNRGEDFRKEYSYKKAE